MRKTMRRVAAIAVTTAAAAVATGLAAPAAQAADVAAPGCIDNLIATNLTAGYVPPTYSSHWLNWVVVDGSGNVSVYTADLIADMTLMSLEWVRWSQIVATNAEGATLVFVACVG
jgi:hypothetical protein